MRGGIYLAEVGDGLVKDDSQVFAFGSWVDNITIFWKVEFMELSEFRDDYDLFWIH